MTEAELIEALRTADGYGALHIVVEDGNIGDEHIAGCMEDPEITDSEMAIARELLARDEDGREALFRAADIQPAWWDDFDDE